MNGGPVRLTFEHIEVLVHDLELVHRFDGVVMPGVPLAILQPLLDFAEPLFCRLVHRALIDPLEKYLSRLVLYGHGVAQYHVHLPFRLPSCCH